ncbi:hypothetical protein JG688_00017837, partial [Phytophthora aleatoria]
MCKSSTGYRSQQTCRYRSENRVSCFRNIWILYPLNEPNWSAQRYGNQHGPGMLPFSIFLCCSSPKPEVRNGILSDLRPLFLNISVDSACSSLQYRYRQERHHWS